MCSLVTSKPLAESQLRAYSAAIMINMTQFWLVAAIITILAFFLLWSSARRGAFIVRSRKGASDALREAQITEIERNLEAGQIDEDTAMAMRQDITRAHSRATRRGEDGNMTEGPSLALWGIIAVALMSAVLSYAYLGAPGYPDLGLAKRAEMETPNQERMIKILAENNALPPAPILSADTQNILNKLNEAIAKHPEVAEGYYHLRVLHYGTGNFREAYLAQAKYMDIEASNATANDYAILAETMVLSVNGYISPQAKEALQNSLKLDPRNDLATFYMGLSLKQEGSLEDAKTVLSSLLSRDIENPEWVSQIHKHIEEIDGEFSVAKDPSAEDIANAADLSDEDRTEMIGGMVDRLRARLAENGGTPDEWARLIASLRVLGRDDEANAILGEALQKFPDNAAIKALAQ